jgi:hypothetical protein
MSLLIATVIAAAWIAGAAALGTVIGRVIHERDHR